MADNNHFYITTPIYYVTAKPHLGSLYSTLLADIFARWHRMHGDNVFFLTGTDEHGQKVAQAAQQAGKEPKAFVDSFIPAYQDAWQTYEIDYTKFIRTTDEYHIHAVQRWLEQMIESGDVYKSVYTGWYCTPCETFVTEKEYDAAALAPDQAPSCPSCGRATTKISEETYFFRLSAYQEKLLEFYQKNPDFIVPKERMAEVVNFVKAGLKDLSISRTTITWGIPFAHDKTHVAYVWADALANYITGVGFNQPGKEQEFATWWPAQVHVMGKDIVRFHAVYWPAFLMASGLQLPKQLLVHGWIKVGQQKMSKSLGNVVDPMELARVYGVEPVRYYLARHMAINHDGEFSTEDIEQKVASELANDLGNLLNRMVTLAEKYDAMSIPAPEHWGPQEIALRDECVTMVEQTSLAMKELMLHQALGHVWKCINQINAYFHHREPWRLAKHNYQEFKQVLSATAHSLRAVAYMIWPVMPTKMELLLTSLGVPFDAKTSTIIELGMWNQQFVCMKVPVLFAPPAPKESEPVMNNLPQEPMTPPITIDDFLKVELLVGTILSAEYVEKSDKLLRLKVDFGTKGTRTILSGIRKHYQPEQLLGKQGTFVFNLQPRKMLGEESQGMMLFAQDAAGTLQIVAPAQLVPNGTQLK